MTEIACKSCNKLFQKRTARSRFCSPTCQHRDWVSNNREHANAYARSWASKNPETMEKYNATRRKGWAQIICKNPECGKQFERTSGSNKFCSIRCRNRVRENKPEYKKWKKMYLKKWRAKNSARYRAKLRAHYHKHVVQKRHMEPWRDLLKGRKRDAKKRGIIFELTPEWAKQNWTGYCALTRIKFASPEQRSGHKRISFSPSIDKIIPALGYTEANSRFVLWAINSFKRDGTDEEMYQIATALLTNKNTNISRKHLPLGQRGHSLNTPMLCD